MILILFILLLCIVYAREILYAIGMALLLAVYLLSEVLHQAMEHWVWTLCAIVFLVVFAAVAVRLEDGHW